MSNERTRARIIELVQQMKRQTVENGCTPGEAAKFAAKAAEWIERYQIEDAEMRVSQSTDPASAGYTSEDVDVCEHTLRTGKKVFNPGMTQVVVALARGMCCRVILDSRSGEAVYGVMGDAADATYVCQVALTVVPALQLMAKLEGAEHGYEKAGLIRWSNQYLTGAAVEIQRRLEAERASRSKARRDAVGGDNRPGTALAVITGESIAAVKREVVNQAFAQQYPRTRKAAASRSEYNHQAYSSGREAGKRVGLHIGLEE